MKILLYQWARKNLTMLVNTGSLIGTTAVTSVLGFAYWWLAARIFSPQALGLGSAIISAMILLGTIGILGLGTMLIGELPRQPGRESSLISAALLVVGVITACLGILFAIVASFLAADFRILGASSGNMLLFAIGVSLTGITLVLDEALIGLLRTELRLWRNTLFALTKLAALFAVGLWLTQKVGLTLYATWAIGNAISLLVLAGSTILRRKQWGSMQHPQWQLLRYLGPAALQHHVFNLLLNIPVLILPVLVTLMLSATANAWFYIALAIANLPPVFTMALTTVLYAETSARPEILSYKMRSTLTLSLLVSVVSTCVLLFASDPIMNLFGPGYAAGGAWSLRILTLATFPEIIKFHYIAACRIHRCISSALLPIIAIDGMQLLGAALGASLGGLVGLSISLLITDCICALFLLPAVYRVTFPQSTLFRPAQLLFLIPFTTAREKGQSK